MDERNDILKIAGKDIPIKICYLPQAELKFYSENPRIYSIIRISDKNPSQDEIEERLKSMDHVNSLVQSIKAIGLLDPLIVRDKDFVVLEGNSRLAAYRILAHSDPIKWGQIKCYLLPNDIGEDLVFALLGAYHIIGRKDWAPFEQAGYLWRRNKQHGIAIEKMAKEMGISERRASDLVEVFSFMVDNGDNDVQHWSYYEEYLKSRAINKRRTEFRDMDKIVVKKIKGGDISKAIDIRDKVVKIAEAGGKTLSKFLSGKGSLDECHESAIMRGMDNVLYRNLKRFRTLICEPDTKKELKDMAKEHFEKCKFELNKIKAQLHKLMNDLGL